MHEMEGVLLFLDGWISSYGFGFEVNTSLDIQITMDLNLCQLTNIYQRLKTKDPELTTLILLFKIQMDLFPSSLLSISRSFKSSLILVVLLLLSPWLLPLALLSQPSRRRSSLRYNSHLTLFCLRYCQSRNLFIVLIGGFICPVTPRVARD